MATKHVFISYSCMDEEYAVKLNEDIKRRGYKTWFDLEQSVSSNAAVSSEAAVAASSPEPPPDAEGGAQDTTPEPPAATPPAQQDVTSSALLPSITDGLFDAFAIIVLVSPSYSQSVNGRRELETARELEACNKGLSLPLICVILDKFFKPSPWLEHFIGGLPQYNPDDFSGIAKKIWSNADAAGKSLKIETKVTQYPLQELVDWLNQSKPPVDSDISSLEKLKQLSTDLAQENIRTKYAKDVLPALSRLIQSGATSTQQNPRVMKNLITAFLHFALDNVQTSSVRTLLTDGFRASVEKIVGMSTSNEAWEATGTVAKDLRYIITTGALGSGKKKVLVSYHWDSKVVAHKLADFFIKHAADWEVFDVERNSGGYFMEKSAAAIATASVVVILVSPGYEGSANCKAELSSAKKWNKHMVFVQPSATYSGGDSWLSFAVGRGPIYNLFNLSKLNEQLSDIVRMELEKHDEIASSMGAGAASLATVAARGLPPAMGNIFSNRPVSIRSPDDMHQWLETIGFENDHYLHDKFDAEEITIRCLSALAAMGVMDLKSLLGISKVGDVLKLKAGLDDLLVV